MMLPDTSIMILLSVDTRHTYYVIVTSGYKISIMCCACAMFCHHCCGEAQHHQTAHEEWQHMGGVVGTLAGGAPWPHCCATVVDNTPIVLQGGGWAGPVFGQTRQ